LEEKDNMKKMVDAEEDEEPPELIMRDDNSNKVDPNTIIDTPEQEETCYEGLTLDDWYLYEYEEELKDTPWYYRLHFKQWGIYANSDFKGPRHPAYMHFLLVDESGCGVDGANIRNKRKAPNGPTRSNGF